MKFYWSVKDIPGLENLSTTERIAALEKAATQMTVPEKTLLNVLKLLVLVPVFIYILRTYENWTALLWVIPILLIYPLIIKPLQFSMCAKYLEQPDK